MAEMSLFTRKCAAVLHCWTLWKQAPAVVTDADADPAAISHRSALCGVITRKRGL